MIAVIGLGYVGHPLALALSEHFDVVGFDIDIDKVIARAHEAHELGRIKYTLSTRDIKDCTFFIIAVPTDVDRFKVPDLTPLKRASETVSKCLKDGDVVVYESTVYPGCTQDVCYPILKKSGKNFGFGYSPERINPGDKEHRLDNTQKIISGDTPKTLDKIREVYSRIAPVYECTIEEAEAAKVLENTQRDVNIALMNEAAIIFGKLGIDTFNVVEAMNTKWNALGFVPGLVGGHCIGIDPYYLAYRAQGVGYTPYVITAGRYVNESFARYIARQVVQRMSGDKVLVMGCTFKENVPDIRNSKVFDLVDELERFGKDVRITDPIADEEEVFDKYGYTLLEWENKKSLLDIYDCIIVAVAHEQYLDIGEEWFGGSTDFLVDVKGIYDFQRIKIWRP